MLFYKDLIPTLGSRTLYRTSSMTQSKTWDSAGFNTFRGHRSWADIPSGSGAACFTKCGRRAASSTQRLLVVRM
jgi:hypothetical protein